MVTTQAVIDKKNTLQSVKIADEALNDDVEINPQPEQSTNWRDEVDKLHAEEQTAEVPVQRSAWIAGGVQLPQRDVILKRIKGNSKGYTANIQ